jgi:hypothetical protein
MNSTFVHWFCAVSEIHSNFLIQSLGRPVVFSYSSFPHGGWVLTWFMLSTCAALAATMWGVATCRFLFVDYVTDRGDFSDFFADPTADGDPVRRRVGAGLFSWLTPYDGEADWTDGQCSGYTERQREHFGDTIFEVARIFAVFATLGGMGITLWVLFLACISLGRFQLWMMSAVLGFIAVSVGLTFMIFQSKLCTDLVTYQDVSFETKCTIDQGGLVVIAAVIFWVVAFLISVVYIKPPEADLTLQNGRITNAFEERQQQRLRRGKERKMQQTLSAQRRKQKRHSSGREPEDGISSYVEGDTEVQLGRSESASPPTVRASWSRD